MAKAYEEVELTEVKDKSKGSFEDACYHKVKSRFCLKMHMHPVH